MWCRHKFGKPENGYQTCEKCGRTVPVECSHKWSRIKESKLYHPRSTTMQIGYTIELQCQKCGEVDFQTFVNRI